MHELLYMSGGQVMTEAMSDDRFKCDGDPKCLNAPTHAHLGHMYSGNKTNTTATSVALSRHVQMRKRIDSSPMTRRQPCIVFAMLCCLLSVATSASAEGDVLLWSHGYYAGLPPNNGTKERWDLVQTFDVAGCDVAAAWFREHDSGPLAATRRVRVEYVCMPDTVDPRGPKEK